MTTDDDAFLVTQDRRQALDALAALSAGGLDRLVLTGPAGVGKSAVIERWLESYEGEATVVLINADGRNPAAFLRQLGLRLKIDIKPDVTNDLMGAWRTELTKAFLAGQKALLVIDDADQLDSATADTVKMLTGAPEGGNVVLRLVAVGLPTVAPVFSTAARGVKSRHVELVNLSAADTGRFLDVLGVDPGMAAEAFDATGGNPGMITDGLSSPAAELGAVRAAVDDPAKKGAPKARLFETPAERKKRLAQTTYDSDNPRDFFRWGLGIGEGEQPSVPAIPPLIPEPEEAAEPVPGPELDLDFIAQHLRATGQTTGPAPVLPLDAGPGAEAERRVREASDALRRKAQQKSVVGGPGRDGLRIDLDGSEEKGGRRGVLAVGLSAFLAVGILAILGIKAFAPALPVTAPAPSEPEQVATATPAPSAEAKPDAGAPQPEAKAVVPEKAAPAPDVPPKEVVATAPSAGTVASAGLAAPAQTTPVTARPAGQDSLLIQSEPMVLAETAPADTTPGPMASDLAGAAVDAAPDVFVTDYLAGTTADAPAADPEIAAAVAARPDGPRVIPALPAPVAIAPEQNMAVSSDVSKTEALLAAELAVAAEAAPEASEPAALRLEVNPMVRDVGLVQTALKHAPGLGDLEPDELQALTEQLSNGACVDQALRAATGKVNRHTLAALLRHMNMCPTEEPGSY